MKRIDLYKTIDNLVSVSAGILADNYNLYNPKSGNSDPNERDITTAFSNASKTQGLKWHTYTEVPINHGRDGNSEARIDMLMLPESEKGNPPESAILIESKNISINNQFTQIKGDFLKMEDFSGRDLKDSTGFPKARLHLALMLDWNTEEKLRNKLSHLSRDASCDEEIPILKMIPRNGTNYHLDPWLVGLCRWHGTWV